MESATCSMLIYLRLGDVDADVNTSSRSVKRRPGGRRGRGVEVSQGQRRTGQVDPPRLWLWRELLLQRVRGLDTCDVTETCRAPD